MRTDKSPIWSAVRYIAYLEKARRERSSEAEILERSIDVSDAGTKAPLRPEYYPHVFQQSVTLTAKMWHGGNSTGFSGASEDWRWSTWRIPPEYAPLLIGFCCGVAVVLLAISATVVWRCILIPNRKDEYSKNIYEEVNPHPGNNGAIPVSRDSAVFAFRNGEWGYQSRLVDRSSTIYRSATLGTIPVHSCFCENENKRKSTRPNSQSLADDLETQALLHKVVPKFLPDNALSCNHSEEDDIKERSKSTPALEDLYAKVNFSKKRKNRMRKDEAAIIALSKSRSGHDSNSIALADGAIVVYNERTAL
ncbi:UNVERIFIED_CONTAM: hypothetical protein PYX00_006820 [Menopon gallinae]|uniref:Uncharacterized protein n=1 Tax=Menopon gallinae TaxID=328185 RepID=A0AAW2HXS5_9NEOP